MSTKGHAVNEAQLKARRTSLGKKTNEELITIILRKDKTERTLNKKVNDVLNEISVLNKKYTSETDAYKRVIDELEESNRTFADITAKTKVECKFWRTLTWCSLALVIMKFVIDFVI